MENDKGIGYLRELNKTCRRLSCAERQFINHTVLIAKVNRIFILAY